MPNFLGRGLRLGAVTAITASALFVTAPASAFCRTTTVALPPNYNPASRGCFTQGLDLFWSNACVGYMINQSASREVPLADAKRIIDAAFETWNSVRCPTGHPIGVTVSDLGTAECGQVRYNGNSPNQNLIVFRDTSWPYNDPNNTLGLTTVTFDSKTGEILDADMEINSSGHNLSITDQVPASGFDLLSVVTHEAGHFLGLAHATSSTSTMFASYKPGTTALRTLTADDIAGVCAIYPDSSVRTVTPTTSQSSTVPAGSCDPTPKYGLTSQCVTAPVVTDGSSRCTVTAVGAGPSRGGIALAGIVAGVALARRRRRRSSALES